ncbi:MAG: hypothetical protein ABII96_03625 [Candidatus Zixiibacteriota bacterium]
MRKKLKLCKLVILFLGIVFLKHSTTMGVEKPKAVSLTKTDVFASFFPEQNRSTDLCLIQNDDGTPVAYGAGFDSGMGLVAYMDPALCVAYPIYPFRITNVHLYLLSL